MFNRIFGSSHSSFSTLNDDAEAGMAMYKGYFVTVMVTKGGSVMASAAKPSITTTHIIDDELVRVFWRITADKRVMEVIERAIANCG